MRDLRQNIHAKLQQLRRYFSTLQPLARLLWQASPAFFLLSCALTLLSGLFPLGNIFVTSSLLQILVQAAHPHASPTLSTNFLFLLLLMGGIALVTQILQRLNVVVQGLHRTRVTNYVQMLIAEKASLIDLACFEDPEFHNQMRTSANEASYRIPMFLDRLLQMGTTCITVVSLAAVLFAWQVWIVPAIFVASIATLLVSTRFGSKRVQLIKERSETERKKYYFQTLLTSEQGAKEVRLFGLRDFLLVSFRGLLELTYQQDRKLAFRELSFAGAASSLLAIVQPGLYAFTALQALQGLITIGQFSFYTQSIAQVQSGWTQLIAIQSLLHENNLFAAHLFEFLAKQPQVEARRSGAHTPKRMVPRIPRMLPREMHNVSVYSSESNQAIFKKTHLIALAQPPHIEFRNVSFYYSGTQKAVLKDVSFVIRHGEAIALVGENGAGKTTLIKLLAGLYEPSEGHIFLNGIDIQGLDRDELRAQLSVIFQDFTIYHFSARDNVGVGQVNSLHDFDRIQQAAKRSGLDRVVARLPDGYETVLGRVWDKGHELSGGQQQLVALARALLRNAPILILDEPSSALDVYTEQHFFQQLLEDRNAGELQTVLFISHRFTTARRADKIFVLEHGQLIEQGSHERLMALGGAYAEMFNLQVAPYNGPQQVVQYQASFDDVKAEMQGTARPLGTWKHGPHILSLPSRRKQLSHKS